MIELAIKVAEFAFTVLGSTLVIRNKLYKNIATVAFAVLLVTAGVVGFSSDKPPLPGTALSSVSPASPPTGQVPAPLIHLEDSYDVNLHDIHPFEGQSALDAKNVDKLRMDNVTPSSRR